MEAIYMTRSPADPVGAAEEPTPLEKQSTCPEPHRSYRKLSVMNIWISKSYEQSRSIKQSFVCPPHTSARNTSQILTVVANGKEYKKTVMNHRLTYIEEVMPSLRKCADNDGSISSTRRPN